MKYVVTIILLFNFFISTGQPPDIKRYLDLAEQAYADKAYEDCYGFISEAAKLHPYHQGVLYMRAKAAARTGRKDEALADLKKAIEINSNYPISVPDFDKIKDSDRFKLILEEQKQLATPIVHSVNGFIVKERTLHAEGITYDPEHQLFYVGSIHKRKIIAVKPNGDASDFCSSAFEGMTGVFGLAIDARRKILWACTSPIPEIENYSTTQRSAVFMFDLTQGKLLKKFAVNAGEPDGIFGDLVVAPDGSVYISDSGKNRIFMVDEKQNDLIPYLSSKVFWNIQGLTFSKNGDDLFVADYIKGIFKVSVKSRYVQPIQAPENYSMKGIDGLYYYNNSLLAIQNGVSPNRATRYYLNAGETDIVKTEIIDRKHPAFGEPTLGVIADGYFYYIANSQWDGYTAGKIKPAAQLKDIIILKYPLDNRP